MRDSVLGGRLTRPKAGEVCFFGFVTAITLAAWMAGGSYAPRACADEPLSISTSPGKFSATTELAFREIRPKTRFVEPASAEIWVSSDDVVPGPEKVPTKVEKVTIKPRGTFAKRDTTTGIVLKTTIGKEIPVDAPRGKAIGGFNSPSLTGFGNPFAESAVAPKRIVLSLDEPAPARKPVEAVEASKKEPAKQPPSAKLAITVPASKPAALPPRAKAHSSVAKTDPVKPADRRETSFSIIGLRASKSLPLEPNRQASRLKRSEPTPKIAPENTVVKLKPTVPIAAAPTASAKKELKAKPIPVQRQAAAELTSRPARGAPISTASAKKQLKTKPIPAAAPTRGLARQEATIRTWPFRSENPFATPKTRRPLFVFEPVSPQWLAKATAQAADNGRRKPTIPAIRVTPRRPSTSSATSPWSSRSAGWKPTTFAGPRSARSSTAVKDTW